MKKLLLLLGGLLLISCSKKEINYPKVSLKNNLLEMEVYLPDAEKGYYRGPRFDWSGMIKSVKYDGHIIFKNFSDNHNPTANDNATGPAEEFGMGTIKGLPPAFNYNNTKIGKLFGKIGVGYLTKVQSHWLNDKKPYKKPNKYRFGWNYPIKKSIPWEINHDKNKISFSQKLKLNNNWSYEYKKEIKLLSDKPGFIITHELKNTGEKTILTSHYSHNFIAIDNEYIGTNYSLELPFNLITKRPLKGLVKINNNILSYIQNLNDKAIFLPFNGFEKLKNTTFIIKNKKSKIGIKIFIQGKPIAINFFYNKNTISPEAFIKLNIKPNEKVKWIIKYIFFKIK